MSELTLCFWMTIFEIGYDGFAFPVSYATPDNSNTMAVRISQNKRLAVWFQSKFVFWEVEDIEENQQTHICVGMSVTSSIVKAYKDGNLEDSKACTDECKIQGGGVLIFGQDQDSLYGGFDSGQAFRGTITNFMIFSRLLTDVEVHQIAHNCNYPTDVLLRPQIADIQKFGQAQVSLQGTCPVASGYDDTTFLFPRSGQTEDWIKYQPAVPEMSELTLCFWMTIFEIGYDGFAFPVSYATPDNSNTMAVRISQNKRLAVWLKTLFVFWEVEDFEENQQTHICVGMSVTSNILKAYKDGNLEDSKACTDECEVEGGGALIFGQEQDSLYGGFDSGQAFSGTITNFMIFPRLLTDDEVYEIAHNCNYPTDVLLRPQIADVQKFGQAEVSLQGTCPVV